MELYQPIPERQEIQPIPLPGPPRTIKIVVTGAQGTGKTVLTQGYTQGKWTEHPPHTIGLNLGHKKVTHSDKSVDITFIDIQGANMFMQVIRNFLKEAQGVIIMYDITKRDTFNAARHYVEMVTQQEQRGLALNPVKILLGTHLDEEDNRVVTPFEGGSLAQLHEFSFHELSAHNDTYVTYILDQLTTELVTSPPKKHAEPDLKKLKVWTPGKTNHTCC